MSIKGFYTKNGKVRPISKKSAHAYTKSEREEAMSDLQNIVGEHNTNWWVNC